MAAKDPGRRTRISSAAAEYRWRPEDPQAQRTLTEVRTEALAEHIRKVIESAPPLTPEQRDRLAVLLRPKSGTAA